MVPTSSLTEIEGAIAAIIDAEGRGGFQIGSLLARVQDDGLWRTALSRDGDPIKSFEHYLKVRAAEWTDLGMRVSVGSMKRWLSHHRVFAEGLGLSGEEMRRLGVATMDELRKVIDYDDTKHEIGPGDGTRVGKQQARQLADTLLQEAAENDGATFFQATREMVEEMLGRVPRKLEVVVEEVGSRFYLRQLLVWQGGDVTRPLDGMDEETMLWLTKKYNAKLTRLERTLT